MGISRIDAHILELRVERDERSYHRGRRQAYLDIMAHCRRGLGFDDTGAEDSTACFVWMEERQSVVNALRDLCDIFDDNDWTDNLHLGDVIEKHLACHLRAAIHTQMIEQEHNLAVKS